jgi:hypothetical protein
MLDNGLSLGDVNSADEGVKKERNSKMYESCSQASKYSIMDLY